jgi:predicted  nucleic acid-binding Zn-ribbon protein
MIRFKYRGVRKTFEDGKMVKKRQRDTSGYELHEGLHEPIISMEQWEKSLEARKNNLPIAMNQELCNPFSRIVKCKKCGRTIIRRTTSNNPPKYRLSCPNRECDCRSIFLKPFEEAVVKEMTAWLDKYTITIQSNTVTVDENLIASLKQIEKQIADAEVQQEKICDLLEKGIYTIEMFSKRNEKLQSELNSLKLSAQKIKEEVKKQEERASNSTQIVPKVQHILDSYDLLNAQQKNDLWREVLVRIEFYAEPKGKDFHIDLYPRI